MLVMETVVRTGEIWILCEIVNWLCGLLPAHGKTESGAAAIDWPIGA